MSAAGVQNSTIITSAKTSHGVTMQGHMACVSRSGRLLSLQDKQLITRTFLWKILEDCNFLMSFANFENPEKYPLLKNTCSTVLREKQDVTLCVCR